MRSNQLISILSIFIFLCSYSLSYSAVADEPDENTSKYLSTVNFSAAAGDPLGVQAIDLRGNDCYPQIDKLVSCGSPDTLSLLFFTKSEDPILDVLINLDYGNGLQYGGFAEIGILDGSGTALLDVLNSSNPTSPTFRLSELSQAGGGVVVNIAVQATCGVDLVANPAGFNLNIMPGDCDIQLAPVSAIICTPEVNISAPAAVVITDLETDFCTAQTISQIVPEASAGEITFMISDYGFPTVDLTTIDVDGVPVPVSSLTVDPVNGAATVVLDGNANAALFGGDGVLDFGETAVVNYCFSTVAGCLPVDVTNPVTFTTSVFSTCNGQLCGPGVDTETSTVRIAYNFGTLPTAEIEIISEAVACDPATGMPTQFVMDVTIGTSRPEEIQGTLEDFRTQLSTCNNGALVFDRIEIYTGGTTGGTLVAPPDGEVSATLSGAGVLVIDFRGLKTDVDGAGGLDDTNGDTSFDDLLGGTTFAYRVYFDSGSCADGACPAIPDPDDDPTFCDFSNLLVQSLRDCGTRAANRNVAIDNFTELIVGADYGIGGDTLDIEPNNVNLHKTGFDFGQFGIVGGVPTESRVNGQVGYTPIMDVNSCPIPGNMTLQITYESDSIKAENLEIENLTFNGMPLPVDKILDSGDIAVFEVNTNTICSSGTSYEFLFEMVLDTIDCSSPVEDLLSFRVFEDCPDCECGPFLKVCAALPTVAEALDPDEPKQPCAFEYTSDLARCSFGFADKAQTIPLTEADFTTPAQLDNLKRVLPGDTVSVTQNFTILQPDQFNERTGSIFFRMDTPMTGTYRFDHNTTRLQSFTVCRGDTVFDLADSPAPPATTTTGRADKILLGNFSPLAIAPTGIKNFNDIHPGLPVGSYRSRLTNSSRDELDGRFYGINFYGPDVISPGNYNGIQTLLDLVGGAFEEGDIVKINYKIVAIKNPTILANENSTVLIDRDVLSVNGIAQGEDFIDGKRVQSQISSNSTCSASNTVTVACPKFLLESEINYDTDCEATLSHTFTVDPATLPPASWFADPMEYRPILGLETFTSQFPAPYIYSGGVTYEINNGLGPIDIEPNSISSTTLVAGSHCADGSFGELNFEDAEFTNGVRAPGYDDYDTDTDVTTIGGTFPMIGVGGAAIGTPCELVFTVPLTRLCAADAPANVVASYTGAYPHLADYNVDPYRCNNAFFDVDGGAPGSCGDTGLSGFYWPWDRLNGNNPHRQSGGGQVVEANIATSTTLDITVETPVLADMGGGEINTYTVCNQSGGPITDGIFTITVPPNVTLDASVPALTLDGVTSLGTIYSIDLTEGTADGNCFEFELTTTLVYCDDTSICASALPCGADVELVAAKMLDCVASECYNYQGGSNGLTSAIMFSNVAPCSTSPYVLDLFNTGTGFLNNVNAVVYLPAGATPALPFTVTSSTGASTTIPAAEDPAFTGADGIAYVLDAAALAAFLGPDGLDPEEGLTITTDVTFACDFISGGTPALLVEADGDCIPFEHTNTGAPINTLPPADEPTFVFQSDDLQLSCSSGGAEVVVTGLNTSKSESENTRICIQVPEGLTLTMGDISAVAPTGYMPTNLTTTPLGTSGDMEISFDGPMSVAPGEFFCLSLMFTVDDLECGIYEVGIQAKSITEVDCNGMVCDMSSIAAEAVLPFEVVPAAAIGEANLYAGCNADPTMTDLDFEIILESVGTTYNGDIDVELFFDLDDNGIVDPYDTSLGEVAATAAIPAEGEGLVTGSISVPNEMACSIVAKLTIPGCACSMVFIPFPEVAPAFLGELGDAVAVCPGDPLIIEEVCGDVMIEFVPAGAGTVVIDPVGETATVMLNDGFGVAAPVQLKTTFSAGPCSDQMFFTDIQSVGDFDFGPYEVFSCNDLTTQIDLMIPPALQSNIDVLITPALYLDDPTIIDPSFINPAANQSYVVEFSLNGACMSATTLDLIVTERAEITVEGNFMMCDTIFDLDGIVEIDPEVGAEWSTMGDGLFDNGAATADVASSPRHYAPGPADIAAGMVTLLIETMEGEPCGSSIARVEIEIIEDVTPPNITCPNNICVPNDPDWCGAMLNLPLILVEDDCTTSGPGTDPGDNNLVIEYNIDGGPWSTTDINNMFFDNGIATIGVRATDEAGNMSECFFTYEVKDKQAPDVICQDLVLDLGNNGPCETTITADQLGGLSTDECVDDVPLMIGLTSDDLGSTYEITHIH